MGERRSARGLQLCRAALPALLAVVLAAATAPAQTKDITVEDQRREKRVALVIGNADYARERLRNPVNDARAIGETLRTLGFEVLLHTNLDEKALRRVIDDFGRKLRGSGVGLFYYSGHGIQLGGKNYLVPVDAKLDGEGDVEYEAVDVGRVLGKMDKVNRLNIVILDACRNNPFEKAWRSTGSAGLAQMAAPTGTFIAYATGPGRLASDGAGVNGLYTGELLQAMRVPGLSLFDVFARTGQRVRARTQGKQEPWIASNVYEPFMFTLPGPGPAPRPDPPSVAAVPPPPPPPPDVRIVPRVGTLVLRSAQPAVIWLGERRLGETGPSGDLEIDRLQAGTHLVKARARREGFQPWEKEVQVAADQRNLVVIDIEPLGPATTLRTEDGAEMLRVPAGEFVMGSEDYDDEKPRHRVHLNAFYIDKFEVTNALYRRCVQTGTCKEPEWNEPGGKYNVRTGTDKHYRRFGEALTTTSHPVVGVSWNDADAYCRWAGKRLPTEAEWEKAARGTDGRKYPWGEPWDASRANSSESQLGKTAPVGSYASGVSPYGAHDMAGNVWEWVADWYAKDYYERSPERNPQGPDSGTSRVLRGGSWSSLPIFLRSAFRLDLTPDYRDLNVGFRCARGPQ